MESFYQGGKTITLPSFNPDTYLASLLQHQPEFLKKAPQAQFREAWGMTELSALGTFTPDEGLVPGSCGKILPNTELKVVDLDSGENLGPGIQNKGEICIRGPQVM